MLYWLDTEFIEDGKTIELISIGIVAEDGREFYAESNDIDFQKASPWVKDNVLPNLISRKIKNEQVLAGFSDRCVWGIMSKHILVSRLMEFLNPETHGIPEFWADYCSYDWVVFCQLFGTMMNLPKGFPMFCNDIRQLVKSTGVDEKSLPAQVETQHNALYDAKYCKTLWEFLTSMPSAPNPWDGIAIEEKH